MGLMEGSRIAVNLYCGCKEVSVTLLHGNQKIKCPDCGTLTIVDIKQNAKDQTFALNTHKG